MINSLLKLPESSPEKIFFLRESSFAPDLFTAAVSYLDFFNKLEKRPISFKDICTTFMIKERPADVMLTLFKAYGFIKEEEGLFSNTKVTRDFLLKSSPFDLSSFVGSLKERPVCVEMVNVLKTDIPAAWAAKKKGRKWEDAMDDAEFAKDFSSAMNSRGAYLANGLADVVDLKDYQQVLDIGGGSGIYSAILCSRQNHLKATILEKSPVHKAAAQFINTAGLDSSIHIQAGDMFKDTLPKGFDVHLISHVLHDWAREDVKKVLKSSFSSLNPGGIVIIHDAHINEKKSGPLSIAEYSVLLMFLSQGKCYSVNEMKKFLQEAGFLFTEYKPTLLNRSVIIGKKSG